MDSFRFIRKVFIEIGIIPQPGSFKLKLRRSLTGICIFLSNFSIFVSTIVFDILNVKTDFEGSLFSIKQACAVFGSFYTMVALRICSDRLVVIFAKYQEIFDKSKSASSSN